jgi:hypothetical protein
MKAKSGNATPRSSTWYKAAPLKDVAVRLRNATYRSNYSARDADEVRLLVSYSVALLVMLRSSQQQALTRRP